MGIVNVPLASIVERTREIGTRRAVGARRRDVLVRLATDADRAAVKALRYVLQRKDEVSYMATSVRPDDAARVLGRLQQFGDWAERRYEQLA